MDLLRNNAKKLLSALPQEAVPTNVIRHILKLIREEYVAKVKVGNFCRYFLLVIYNWFDFRLQKQKVSNHCTIY